MNRFWKQASSNNRADTGRDAEAKAEHFLHKNGLKTLKKNYSCRVGELDLIMRDGNTIVFVEVRFRSSNSFGGAAASVTYSKQKKILKTAEHFLQKYNLYDKQPVRFDVLAMSQQQHNWIKGAF